MEVDGPYENHKPQEIKFKQYDATQELIFPPALMKCELKPLNFYSSKTKWFRPVDLNQLLFLKSEYPNATLVSGNTRIGIEKKFLNLHHEILIYIGDIPELKSWEFKDDGLYLGANMSISQAKKVLKEACNHYKPHQSQIFEALLENLKRFATNQIRQVSTLGGNIIANISNSDLIPFILSSKSIFYLTSLQSTSPRSRPIPSVSFWTGYKQDCRESSEILEKIFIPCSKQGQYFRTYKQSKRHYGDTAIVNAAVVRAPKSENFISGKKWGDENVLKQLLKILCEVSSDIENCIGEIKRDISKGSQTI
ncbi:19736_t:CDS:2, partial [Racocetra fulgida]